MTGRGTGGVQSGAEVTAADLAVWIRVKSRSALFTARALKLLFAQTATGRITNFGKSADAAAATQLAERVVEVSWRTSVTLGTPETAAAHTVSCHSVT